MKHPDFTSPGPVHLRESTKSCPRCNNTQLVLLTTFNLKICPDCHTKIPWNLAPGQKPLY